MTDTTLPPPPYPAGIRAKGWRFELDYEAIESSDTWGLAAEVPMAQPALLMLWLIAWRETPCGSLPDDEDVIRSKCRIPVDAWPTLRGVLMRGWWRASDGRLYHRTLTKRVTEMMTKRRSDADRVATWRAKKAASDAAVTQKSRVTNGALTREYDTGTGTDREALETRTKRARASDDVEALPIQAAPTTAGLMCRAMKANGVIDVNPGNPDLLALIAAGASEAEFAAAAQAAARKGKGFAYAIGALIGQRQEAAKKAGQLAGAPGQPVAEWFETAGGIKAEGARRGMPYTREDECRPFDEYRARVFAAAGHVAREAA